MARYLVPAARARVETRAGNSRFIATIDRTDTVEAARELLQAVRGEMPDATHHVHAYIIGYGASVTEGVSDDGEPTGTSGPPTLAVLRGAKIGDTTVITTRYFGGTKLGTGGLVAAYSQAAKAVIAAVKTEQKVDRIRLVVDTPFRLLDSVKRGITQLEGVEIREEFAASVRIEFAAPVERLAQLREQIANISRGGCTIQVVDGNAKNVPR